MKGILKGKVRSQTLPEDGLSREALNCEYYSHAGFPEATDSLAYDAVQRILAVGTTDGRVKVIGKRGVETLLVGDDASGTRQMLFLHGKGALARVTEAGDLQLWSLEEPELLVSLPFVDPITALEQVPDSPYLCAGSESGALRFVQLTTRSGSPATGVCEACTLELLPYELTAEELRAEGALTSLSASTSGDQQRLLGLHAASGAMVWDIRQQCCVARTALAQVRGQPGSAFDSEEAQAAADEAGPARSACWVGHSCLSFATGHEMGAVLIWVLPLDASRGGGSEVAVAPNLMMRARVAPGEELAMPVRQLQYLEGECLGGSSSLLAFGGQVLDQPDTLSLISLDSMEDGLEASCQPLPWYGAICGFAVVPQKGALGSEGDAAAVLVLMEGGQLVLFALPELQPVPLGLPFQELPDLTFARLAASPTAAGPHSATLRQLRAAVGPAVNSDSSADRWRWVLDGGQPPPQNQAPPGASDVLFTGHKDGRVRVWDLESSLPQLLLTVPFDAGGGGTKLRPVTAVEVELMSGLLVVAHEKGEVRVYQFTPGSTEAVCLELEGHRALPRHEEESGRSQPAGFQRLLRLSHHTASVSCLALAPAEGLLACGDESGALSVTNLREPKVTWSQLASDLQLASLAFCVLPAGIRNSTDRARDALGSPGSGVGRPALVAVSSEGGLAAFDAASGTPCGPKVSPRSPDSALCLVLLDALGSALSAPASLLDLLWAQNTQRGSAIEPASVAGGPGHLVASRPSPRAIGPSRSEPPGPAWDLEEPQIETRLSDTHVLGNPSTDEQKHQRLGTAPSVDEDSFLAAAAEEAVAAREGTPGGRKPRLKSLFKGEVAGVQNPSQRWAPRHSDESSRKSEPVAIGRRPSDESSRKTEPAAAKSRGSSEDGRSPKAEVLHSRPSSSGTLLEPIPLPSPAFLAVATTSYLRLYPVECLQSGERTTARKVTLEEHISFAAPFSTGGRSGLLCLSSSGRLQIFSLPGLEPLLHLPLYEVLGFPWSWAKEPAMAAGLQRLCTAGADGQLVLAGAAWELARLAVAHSGWRPAGSSCLYDWQLAEAAAAAAAAAKRTASMMSEEASEEDARETLLQPGSVDHKRGFGGFLNQVKDGVVNVGVNVGSIGVNTGRNIGSHIGSHIGSTIGGLGRRDHRDAAASAQLPSLERVLSNSGRDPASQATEAGSNGPVSRDSIRAQLLAGRVKGRPPGPRTADEIKQAYGRSLTRRGDSVAALAEENRAKLAERGERLQSLNNRAESMANDAKDFASLAKAIRDREAEKKWWQL